MYTGEWMYMGENEHLHTPIPAHAHTLCPLSHPHAIAWTARHPDLAHSHSTVSAVPTPIQIAIIEDRTEIREGLATLIDASEGFRCVGTFDAAEPVVEHAASLTAEVVLMDIGLPGMDGVEATHRLKTARPDVQVMMLTVYEDDDHVFGALQAGATGYVLKKMPPAQLLAHIRMLAEGGSPMSSQIARRVVETFHRPARSAADEADLTSREREVLALLVQGHRYREIAEALHISLDTVRTHIRHIYEKMHVRSRTEATLKYLGKA